MASLAPFALEATAAYEIINNSDNNFQKTIFPITVFSLTIPAAESLYKLFIKFSSNANFKLSNVSKALLWHYPLFFCIASGILLTTVPDDFSKTCGSFLIIIPILSYFNAFHEYVNIQNPLARRSPLKIVKNKWCCCINISFFVPSQEIYNNLANYTTENIAISDINKKLNLKDILNQVLNSKEFNWQPIIKIILEYSKTEAEFAVNAIVGNFESSHVSEHSSNEILKLIDEYSFSEENLKDWVRDSYSTTNNI